MSDDYEGPQNWRDEAKALEQQLMILKDQYAEWARALGSPSNGLLVSFCVRKTRFEVGDHEHGGSFAINCKP